MMALTGVVFNHFPAIAASLKPQAQRVVKGTATYMQGVAKSGAAVRTGFMQENIYVSTWDSSDYGTGSIAPPEDSYLLPEIKPDNDTSAIVGAAANYSIYPNYGTRFMAAQPFWEPAIVAAQGFLGDELAKMGANLGGSIT